MAKRKPKRGGRRPGAGRPSTTRSQDVPEVRFRLSAADYVQAELAAKAAGGRSVNELARACLKAILPPV